MLKVIISSRQARDKHRENSKKGFLFLSQSFPYLSDRLPALAQQGAFSAKEACASPFNPLPPPRPPPEKTIAAAAEENMASSCTYSTAELKSLVAYAAVRKEKKRKETQLQIRSTQPRPNLINQCWDCLCFCYTTQDRGVRVMWEVDTPAHSASWCAFAARDLPAIYV